MRTESAKPTRFVLSIKLNKKIKKDSQIILHFQKLLRYVVLAEHLINIER